MWEGSRLLPVIAMYFTNIRRSSLTLCNYTVILVLYVPHFVHDCFQTILFDLNRYIATFHYILQLYMDQ